MKITPLYRLEFFPNEKCLHLRLSEAAYAFLCEAHARHAFDINHFRDMKDVFGPLWYPTAFQLQDGARFGINGVAYFSKDPHRLIFNPVTAENPYPFLATIRVLFTVLNTHPEAAQQAVQIRMQTMHTMAAYLDPRIYAQALPAIASLNDGMRDIIVMHTFPPGVDHMPLSAVYGMTISDGRIRMAFPDDHQRKTSIAVQDHHGWVSFPSAPKRGMPLVYLLIMAACIEDVAATETHPVAEVFFSPAYY